MKKHLFFLLFFCILIFSLKAQQQATIDSLTQVLETNLTDKEKVDTYNAIADEYKRYDSLKTVEYGSKAIKLSEKISYSKGLSDAYYYMGWPVMYGRNYAGALELFNKALSIAQESSYPKGEANAYNGIAFVLERQDDYAQALQYLFKSLEIRERINAKSEVAFTYNSIGVIYDKQGDFPKALEFYSKGLKVREELGDIRGMSGSYNNIGIIHVIQGNLPQALEYFFKALETKEKLGDKASIARSYNNIGIIYYYQKDYPKTLEYYFKSLEIKKELEDRLGMGSNYNNIGGVYQVQRNHTQALEYYLKSLEIYKEFEDISGIAANYHSIGNAHASLENYSEAIDYNKKALKLWEETGAKADIPEALYGLGLGYKGLGKDKQALAYLQNALNLAQEVGKVELIKNITKDLSKVQANLKDYKGAYNSHVLYKTMYDSIHNEQNSEELTQQSMQYEFDKKEAAAKAEKEKQELLHEEELKRREYIIYGVIIGFLGLVAFAIQSVRSNRQKQRANQKLSEQNDEIKLQGEEIMQQAEEIAAQRDDLADKNNELEEAYKGIQILSEIGQQVNSSLSVETIAETIYSHVNKLMDATVFSLGIYNPKNKTMEFTGTMEHGRKLPKFTDDISDNNSLSDYCFNNNTEIFIQDMDEEYQNYIPERKAQTGGAMRSIMYIPLSIKGQKKGLLSIQSPKPHQYTDNDFNMLRNLAIYVGTAIENAEEHEKSENLLLNILPQETAQELKEQGKATPKSYDKVSVLFTDFKGFTKIAEKMSEEELVTNLDYCFQNFDRICKKHGLEKIKTIGDAYMAAGGIPVANQTNPQDAIKVGEEMTEFIAEWNKEKRARGEDTWEIRLGIHTGKVVAGVVGKDKFAYDVWGDTVNVAARMEQSGAPGKINISGDTHRLLPKEWEFEYRGKVQAKNKGEVDMYFVEKTS